MKRLFLLALLFSGGIAKATNYYFSSVSGDDSRTAAQAQSPSTPWQSISKLNSIFSTLAAGDSILFKRGETFYGNIVIGKAGTSSNAIKFGAFGTGAKPVITGFTSITAWTNLGNNIWESTSAVSSLATCNLISIGGVNTAYGRMPKTGYWTAVSTTSTSITDATHLNAATTDWTGANVAARTCRWHLDRSNVTSVSGSTINMSAGFDYSLPAGWGYFIQNHPACLTQQNDWCYIASTKKVRIYSTTTPANVMIPTLTDAVTVGAYDYITFDNLNFQGFNGVGINTNSRTGITVQNCDFSFIADVGIQTVGNGNYLKVLNCTFTEINSGGVFTKNSTNNLIQGNTFTNVGNIPGMGGSGDLGYTAIYSYGDNALIQYNSITRTGYVGIRWDGNATVIKGNFINYTNYIKDDGGGIYCYPNNGTTQQNQYTTRIVRDNIVMNAPGAVAGGEPAGVAQGYCIFNDGSSPDINYINNTTYAGRFGLFFQGGYDLKVDSNVVYAPSQIGIYFTNSTTNPITNNSITNNISVINVSNAGVGCGAGKYALDVYGISSLPADWTASKNIYANPLDQTNGWIYSPLGTGSPCKSVSEWQTQLGKDAGSTGSPLIVSDASKIRFEYNETGSPKTITLGTSYVDMRNVSYPSTITIPPYSSVVLLKTGTGNAAPTASAGVDQTITLPTSTVTLSGSGTDPDGSIASYAWTKVSGPTPGTITSAATTSTTVTGLVAGTYKFELKVTDNAGAVGRDTVQVTVNTAGNQAPTANAGVDQTIVLPTSTATLTGSGTDADGTIASYAWTRVSGPTSGTITNATAATTTVTGLIEGVYKFELKVTDNSGSIGRDTMQLNVSTAQTSNAAPVVDAGPTIWLNLPTNSTTLVGTASDADGTIASYAWTKASGPTSGTITSPASATTTVTGLVAGVYKFELKVTDNAGAVTRDTASILVNTPPVANAGLDQNITLPTATVTLSGTGTDADGTIASYAWTKISGPTSGTITSATAASTTVTGLAAGSYQFGLTVTDNSGALAKDTVVVTVNSAAATTAYGGTPWPIPGTIQVENFDNGGQNVAYYDVSTGNSGGYYRTTESVDIAATTSEGTAYIGWTDPGEWLKYSVNVLATGTYTLQARVAAMNAASSFRVEMDGVTIGTFTVPNTGGYEIWQSVTATNIALTAGTKTMRIYCITGGFNINSVIFSTTVNLVPTANAGADQTITLPTSTVSLAGSGTDVDGTIASYAWTKVSGPTAGTITSATAASTTITGLTAGTYKFELKVTDNSGGIGRDTVQVIVNAANVAPVANAGLDQNITLPTSTVTLSGTGTDSDGTIASYAWTKVSGPAAGTITSATSASTTVTGLTAGTYKFELKVTDNAGAIARDTMQVTVNAANVAPVANAGTDKTITLPTNTVTLTGTGTDTDGTIASYAWTKLSGPTSGAITSATSASTTVTGLVAGVYKFELKVTDNGAAIGRDTVQVTVNAAANVAPVANAGTDKTIALPTSTTTLTGTGTDADGTIASYAWTKVSGPATLNIISATAATTNLTALVNGVYLFELKVTDNSGAIGKDTVQVTVTGTTNTPYSGTPIPIPGTVEMEDFDNGGQNVAYYDATTGNTGAVYRTTESVDLKMAAEGTAYIGWTADNEWTKYTVNVTSAGTYSMTARVATMNANNNSAFHIEMDGVTIASVTIPYTGGYETWQNITVNNIPLTAGVKTMRFYIDVAGFNITRIIFTQTAAGRGTYPAIASVTAAPVNNDLSVNIYPNPVSDAARIVLGNAVNGNYTLTLTDVLGNKVWVKQVSNTSPVITQAVDMANIRKGLYILEVISPDQKRKAYKIMKN